ncbi:MAG: hypothetical protein JXX14_26430 [Deltaproteobacteria bacterium]|nr:hypothetical protein [Deltaproteobacteria bacterium]
MEVRQSVLKCFVALVLISTVGASAARASADMNASLGCTPECGPSFLCYQGECISKCNPVCAMGEACTSAGECVQISVTADAPGMSRAMENEADAAFHRDMKRKADAKRERLAYRKRLRLTVHGMFGWLERGDLDVSGGGVQVGMKLHFLDKVAIAGRGGLLVGGTFGNDNVPGGKSVWLPGGDVSCVFGPFGRFYIGPLLWLSGLILPSHLRYSGGTFEGDAIGNRVVGGFGMELGFLPGRHENIDVGIRIKMTDSSLGGQTTVFEAGIGFHFFPFEASLKAN